MSSLGYVMVFHLCAVDGACEPLTIRPLRFPDPVDCAGAIDGQLQRAMKPPPPGARYVGRCVALEDLCRDQVVSLHGRHRSNPQLCLVRHWTQVRDKQGPSSRPLRTYDRMLRLLCAPPVEEGCGGSSDATAL